MNKVVNMQGQAAEPAAEPVAETQATVATRIMADLDLLKHLAMDDIAETRTMNLGDGCFYARWHAKCQNTLDAIDSAASVERGRQLYYRLK